MSERMNRETRLPYAKFDGSIITGDSSSSRGRREPTWRSIYVRLLQVRDYEGAELVRGRNSGRDSDEQRNA